MQKPHIWDAYAQALAGAQEGEISRRFTELRGSELDELVRFAHWCARQHNPKLVPGFVLDPEEVVQDAFVELFSKRHGFKKGPKEWMLGTIRQKLRHAVSKALRDIKNGPEAQERMDAGQDPPVESSLSEERRLAIRAAVNELPARMRGVIIALYYREESVSAVAAAMCIAENTVIQTRRRALRKLQEIL